MTNERKILIFGSVIVVGFVVMLIAVILMFLRMQQIHKCQHTILREPAFYQNPNSNTWYSPLGFAQWNQTAFSKGCPTHFEMIPEVAELYDEGDPRRIRFKREPVKPNPTKTPEEIEDMNRRLKPNPTP